MDDAKIIPLDDYRLPSLVHTPAQLTSLVPAVDEQIDVLPDGFRRFPDGIYRVDPKGDGQEVSFLCSPMRVTAMFRDRDGKGWGRQVEVVDPDGTTHALQIEEAALTSKPGAVRSALANAGLQMAAGQKVSASVIEFLRASKPERRQLRTDRLGWIDKAQSAFVLGSGRVIGGGDVLCSPGLITTSDQDAGTLEDWRTSVAARCIGNDLLLLGVSHGFCGPLLELLGLESGGLHLRGASSSGKTTILRAAVSIWGAPRTLKSWRTTANALEGVAAAANDTLLALDELAEISPEDVFKAVYMLGNDTGKARATSLGAVRAPLNWKVPILSSGEISLEEKIAEAGKKIMDGQKVRLIDVEADNRLFGAFDELHGMTNASDFADSLKEATSYSYGTAGPAFVERLLQGDAVDRLDTLKRTIGLFRAGVRKAFPLLDGVDDRIVTRFALIAVAGEAATRFGITGWPEGTALQATFRQLTEVLNSHHEMDPASPAANASIERVRAFLKINESAFMGLPARGGPFPLEVPLGWRNRTGFMFTAGTWHSLHAGYDPIAAARHLKAAGFLLPGEGSNLAQKAPSGVPGRPRLYVVREELLVNSGL